MFLREVVGACQGKVMKLCSGLTMRAEGWASAVGVNCSLLEGTEWRMPSTRKTVKYGKAWKEPGTCSRTQWVHMPLWQRRKGRRGKTGRWELAAHMGQQVGNSKQIETMEALHAGNQGYSDPHREPCSLLLELTENGLDRCHLIKNAISASWVVNSCKLAPLLCEIKYCSPLHWDYRLIHFTHKF